MFLSHFNLNHDDRSGRYSREFGRVTTIRNKSCHKNFLARFTERKTAEEKLFRPRNGAKGEDKGRGEE